MPTGFHPQRREKFQAPNFKLQESPKLRLSNSKANVPRLRRLEFEISPLEFIWNLASGAWNFFRPQPPHPAENGDCLPLATSAKSSRMTNHLTQPIASALAACIVLATAHAGSTVSDKKSVVPDAPYEAGRGLITLEGPSGMFINPTSATLPQGAYTAQYCLFFPNQDTDIVGHGLMMSYGIKDWLEVGLNGNLVDLNAGVDRELAVGGPLVRVRLLKDESWWPQLSVGAYAKWGSHPLNQIAAFAAAYKRLPISETGPLRSIGLHAGIRETWFDSESIQDDSFIGYWGVEVQLPYRVYLVGELSTKGETRNGNRPKSNPYAWGAQWRLGGVNLSVAAIDQDGTGRVGVYSGVAFSRGF